MNRRGSLFAQAARGPVLLITLGILFALQQAGIVSFSRTWPLIIIVIGVMKLIERMMLPPSPVPPAGSYPSSSAGPSSAYPPAGAPPSPYPPASAPPQGGPWR